MFAHADTKQYPWYVVDADGKKRARLNCISHLLKVLPHEDPTPKAQVLPPRKKCTAYVHPPMTDQTFLPEVYQVLSRGTRSRLTPSHELEATTPS